MLLRIQQRLLHWSLSYWETWWQKCFSCKAQLWFIKYVHDKNVPEQIYFLRQCSHGEEVHEALKFCVYSFPRVFHWPNAAQLKISLMLFQWVRTVQEVEWGKLKPVILLVMKSRSGSDVITQRAAQPGSFFLEYRCISLNWQCYCG